MNVNDPTAQGALPQVEAVTPEQQTQQPQDAFAGVQKRIDELTARYHDSERTWAQRVEALTAQNTELVQALAGRQEPEAPPFEIDPEEQQKLNWMLKQATAPLQQHIALLEAQVSGSQVQQVAAQYGVNDPEVVALANQYVQNWSKQGYFQKGIVTVQNALDLALGAKYRGEAAKRVSQNQRDAYNNGAPGVMTQGAAPPVVRPPQRKELTQEEMEQDPAAAARFYEERLASDG